MSRCRLTGLAAAEAIRSARPKTQIVLHTGQDDAEIRARALNPEGETSAVTVYWKRLPGP